MKTITPTIDKSSVMISALGEDEIILERELDNLYKQLDACEEIGEHPPLNVIRRIMDIERILGF